MGEAMIIEIFVPLIFGILIGTVFTVLLCFPALERLRDTNTKMQAEINSLLREKVRTSLVGFRSWYVDQEKPNAGILYNEIDNYLKDYIRYWREKRDKILDEE